MVTRKIQQAVGRNAPFVEVLPPPIEAQRAPTTTDIIAVGQLWRDGSVTPNIMYTHLGSGVYVTSNLTLSTDDTFAGAVDTTASSSLAIKTYADNLAIAGAPVATTGTSGIGRLVSDANAVARLASTGLQAYFVQPSNLTAVMSAPGPIGDTTPDTMDCTDLVADGLIDLDTTVAAHLTVTGAADLTLDSSAGSVIINGEEAVADAIQIQSAAGGLDLDVALGLDMVCSENAADAIILNASAGGIDITAAGAAGEDIDVVCTAGSINITAGESAANSIVITSSIGGIDILAAGAAAGEDIDIVATGSSVNISSSENAADAITIAASAGGVQITNTGTAGEDIALTSTGASVTITATEDAAAAIYLHANGGVSETVDIHSDLGTGVDSVNIHSDVGGLTLTSGLASADAININASDAAGGIDIDCGTAGFIVDATAGPVSLDSALASNFTITGAADLTLDSSGGSVIINGEEAVVDAIQLTSAAGGLSASVALQMSLVSTEAAGNAIVIDASNAAGGIDVDCGSGGLICDAAAGAISLDSALASNFTVTGAADLTLDSSAGSVIINGEEAVADAIQLTSAAGGLSSSVALQMSLVSTQAAATAIVIDASNAAGGIDMDCGSGGLAIDAAAGAISIDSVLASNFTVTGAADLTLQSTAGSVIVSASESAVDALQLLSTAGGIDILASGAAAGEDIDIIATGSSINIQATESDAAAIVINASGAAGAVQILSGTGGVVFDSGMVVNVTAVANGATPYAILGSDYFITTDTTGGVLSLTFPAAPATGRKIVVYDGVGQAAGNNVTLDGNGKNIAFAGASAATQVLNTAYESATLVYNGTLWCAMDVV